MPVLFKKAGVLADEKPDLPKEDPFAKKSIDLVDSEAESASEVEVKRKKKEKKEKKAKKEKKEKKEDPEEVERRRKKEEKKRKRLAEEEKAVYAKFEALEVPAKRAKVADSTVEGNQRGEYYRRLGDESQWLSKANVKDNSHWTAKRGGDAWGAQAADDLIKVRGKDFKKEMQKKKRASWAGAGTLDTGVNSIVFSDFSD